MDFAHPCCVTSGKIVVDRDNVDTFACQCVEITGESCHKGFAFASAHFCNTALMECDTAHKLNKIRAHAKDTLCRFTDSCKCLHKNIIKCFALFKACSKLIGFATKFFIGQCLVLWCKIFDLLCYFFEFADFSFVFVED